MFERPITNATSLPVSADSSLHDASIKHITVFGGGKSSYDAIYLVASHGKNHMTSWSWPDMDGSCSAVGWTRTFMHGTSNYCEARHLYCHPASGAQRMDLVG